MWIRWDIHSYKRLRDRWKTWEWNIEFQKIKSSYETKFELSENEENAKKNRIFL